MWRNVAFDWPIAFPFEPKPFGFVEASEIHAGRQQIISLRGIHSSTGMSNWPYESSERRAGSSVRVYHSMPSWGNTTHQGVSGGKRHQTARIRIFQRIFLSKQKERLDIWEDVCPTQHQYTMIRPATDENDEKCSESRPKPMSNLYLLFAAFSTLRRPLKYTTGVPYWNCDTAVRGAPVM